MRPPQSSILLKTPSDKEAMSDDEEAQLINAQKHRGRTSIAEEHDDEHFDRFEPKNVEELLELKPLRSGERDGVYLKTYWKLLLLLALFYTIPALQFVINDYVNASKGPDISNNCYYNFKCKKSFWFFEASNNVISNIGYAVAGIGFVIFVKLVRPDPSIETSCGLHRDCSLYYSLGWCLFLEGIFSGVYHICPSRINFQFDTTFMIFGAFILFVAIYQKRHGIHTIGPFKSFLFLGCLAFLNVVSLVDMSGVENEWRKYLFWCAVFALLVVGSFFVSAHVYYNGRYRVNEYLIVLRRISYFPPSKPSRFFFLMAIHSVNFGITIAAAIYTIMHDATNMFSNFTLGLVLLNDVVYISFYVIMKIKSGESINIKIWILLIMMFPFYFFAFYFFAFKQTSDKFESPTESMELNKPCVLFDFFDYHDLWHFLSAGGLLCSMSIVFMLDENLKDVHRKNILVF